jgi:uridylate kinase
MKKEVIVLSLGGSIIVPSEIDVSRLKKFKEVIGKYSNKYKFVVVCGGGSVARKYISALRSVNINEKLQSYAGISATRMNARFMGYFFNKDSEYGIPHTTPDVVNYLKKHDIVFCGALEYKPDQTSDSTSAHLAKTLGASFFVNLTNVDGLFDKNPKVVKNAKLIPEICWKDFDKRASSMEFKPGQHFVLDQKASKIILKNKITTYILGDDFRQLDNLLNGKKFLGTKIYG